MKLYDIAKGTARVEISGAEPERVLNALAQKGVCFWDTTPKSDFVIETTVYSSDYPTLCDLDGKSGCEIKLIGSKGGKRILKNARRRAALLLSLTLCAVMLAASSLFIWDIEIVGNENISDAELLRALSDAGLHSGSFRLTLDAEYVKTKLLLCNDKISWAAVNISGQRAQLVIHERVEKPEIVSEGGVQSIYAAKSGIITKMSVLEGSAAVGVGDTVVQGDLLVSGEMQSDTAETRYVHSMAAIEAKTWYELTCVTPLFEYAKTEVADEHGEISLIIGKNRINFYSDSRNSDASCDKINMIMRLSAGNAFTLPFGIAIGSSDVYRTEYRRIDTDAAALRMEHRLKAELQSRIGDGSIVNTTCTVSVSDELMYVTLRAECIENIAVSGEI